MATDATPGGVDIEAPAAARLLEHVSTWKRRLRDAVDRHYDARAYDVARELHDVVDRLSADLVRVFGDAGLRAPIEAYDGPRPRRGPLRMAVLYAPDADRAAVATGDPDEAYAALTGWAKWLEARAAAVPAPGPANAPAGHDPRLDDYRPASYFRITGSDTGARLRQAKKAGTVESKKSGRNNLYRIGDVANLLNLTSAQLDKLDDEFDKRQLKDPARRENA